MAKELLRFPKLRCLNLWENFICDTGAEVLAKALVEFRFLEYIGLGRNRITDTGLGHLCRPFNMEVLDEAAAKVVKERIKQMEGKVEAAVKAKKAKPKSLMHIETLEEQPPEEGKEAAWVRRKPSDLKTLNLAENPIKSSRVVEALQPLGPDAELVLRGTMAAAAILARPVSPTLRRNVQQEGWLLRLL